MTNVGLAGESTALGDAIMQSIRTISYGQARNKTIILLTDGYLPECLSMEGPST